MKTAIRFSPTLRFHAFDVYRGNKVIDTIFYNFSDNITAEEVRDSLVDHDGYDPRIVVKKVA
jgi:hypothetical protein